ncbi:MAG TPA: hypothetical protein VFE98_04070 [Candidatus Bathyarchaeia archaeon]|nr:hypothetical protein [Candidatus Bathyarchaeia archaeon]
MNSGGVIQASSQNLTLFNRGLAMRLLGGAIPHDELLGPGNQAISSWSFWSILVNATGHLVPMLPISNKFVILGTNSTGTIVTRTMHVSFGTYSGTFEIIYRATNAGPLKWDLLFTPDVAAEYELAYSWLDLQKFTSTTQSDVKSFKDTFDDRSFTFNWMDVPSNLLVQPILSPNQFLLAIKLGSIPAGHQVAIDPTIASNVGPGATAFSFERKIVYSSQSGYYYAFYHNGITVGYSSSRDGINWSSQQSMPSGWPGYWDAPSSEVDVISVGQTVIVASGEKAVGGCLGNCNVGVHPHVWYAQGTMSGSSINWQPAQSFGGAVPTCSSNGSVQCTITAGYRYVNVALSSSGALVFSYNYFEKHQNDAQYCAQLSDTFELSNLYVNYGGTVTEPQNINGCTGPDYSNPAFADTNNDRSTIIPADSIGKVRIIYQYVGTSSAPSLYTTWYDGTSSGTIETIQSTVPDNDQFSAVADSNYGQHLVYVTNSGTVNYSFKASINSAWTAPADVYGVTASYPSVTVDYSTNNIYVLGFTTNAQGYVIIMKGKSLSQSWSDQVAVYPVTNIPSSPTPAYLTSSAISASATNNAQIATIWTASNTVSFASIPIQTVWSPFSAPALPWDGNGLAPYGQYFSNLGEYVSANTGILTIRQTDLSLPGRRINFDITRVYVEPYSFLNCSTQCQLYNYETYPWAPLGNAWQLNFPWMTSTNHPQYIHLWNGEGYLIPSSFWNGFTATFENHQGENFRLVRSVDGTISLYDKSGTLYSFGTNPNHALLSISDSTGNNMVSFNYSNNLISCISDTVQRAFTFRLFRRASSKDQPSERKLFFSRLGDQVSKLWKQRRGSNIGYRPNWQSYVILLRLKSMADCANHLFNRLVHRL